MDFSSIWEVAGQTARIVFIEIQYVPLASILEEIAKHLRLLSAVMSNTIRARLQWHKKSFGQICLRLDIVELHRLSCGLCSFNFRISCLCETSRSLFGGNG